jgi:hypothetical protein
MKAYRSIDKYSAEHYGQHVFGFDKIDGSNFRAEWNKKLSKKSQFTNGFGKFGTRTETIKNANNPYTEAVNIFMDKYSAPLDKIFCENKLFRGIDTITVYGEFAGCLSFAGQHNWIYEENFDVTMFDMFLYKKDFVKPRDFIDLFEHLGIPKLLYSGVLDENLVKDIEYNKYKVKEGLVLKGVDEGKVFMMKVKTKEWLDKVRAMYGEKAELEY